MFPTSYMKISKIRVATGSGRKVRKRVRNQEEAYMDVWKLWDRKWTFSSGSCSWDLKKKRRIIKTNAAPLWMVIKLQASCFLLVDGSFLECPASILPGADTQTGRCRGPARPCWVWTAPADGTPASGARTHKKPPPQASGRRGEVRVRLPH